MIQRNNDHLSVEAMMKLIPDELAMLERRFGRAIRVKMFGPQKVGIDATTKMLICSTTGERLAVVVLSRTMAPDFVVRGVRQAEAIRAVIGAELGRAIVRPIANGYADNRSYVILPYYRDLSPQRFIRLVQRLRLRRPLLNWLTEATAMAADRIVPPDDDAKSFNSMLQYLNRQSFPESSQRRAIASALNRIDSRQWIPRHTFDHNDLRLGNVMLPGISREREETGYPFVLIDWPGANVFGHGIYDLLRISRELKLSSIALRHELIRHSDALKCMLIDTRGHLLASLARLHQHLECWPESQYIRVFHDCWNQLESALSDPV